MKELPIKLELRKLGLSEKEVRVYLAGLELGPTSVKKISEKAEVKRPTTYEIIDQLKEKGLFYVIRERNKRYFVSQSPNKVLGVLRVKKREIEEKEREFIRIIAALEAQYSKEKAEIKIYKGKEGLRVLMEEVFSFTSSSEVLILSDGKEPEKIKKREKIYRRIKKRLGKIKVREIYSRKLDIKPKSSQIQRKFSSSLQLRGTLLLFDKIIFFHPEKEEGLLIENPLMVNLLKSLFQSFWKLID